MKLIELLCARLRWTSDQVEQIILQNLPGRLASALLRLTEKHKLAPQGRTIAITQQEISEMVGMTRESINKQLRAWAARDWVRLEHGAIVVLKPSRCRRWSMPARATKANSYTAVDVWAALSQTSERERGVKHFTTDFRAPR